jgi:hypothetical protein
VIWLFHQKPVRVHLLPIRATCSVHLILLYFMILIILNEEHRSRSSALRSFIHPLVTISFFGPNILLSTLFSKPSVYVLPLISEIKFYTHTEPQAKLWSCNSNFHAFDSRRQDRRLWTERQQALQELNIFLISSWIKFWLLLLFPHILAVTYFQTTFLLFLCRDFDHSGDDTATFT